MIKNLSEQFGVSGREDLIRNQIISEISPFCDDITTDTTGNIIASINTKNSANTTIVCAHMDESGFIITDITQDGYLKFDVVGNIDEGSIISKKVRIGDIVGIIALKAVHLTKKEEREVPVKVSELFIDIGAKSYKEASGKVMIGDYCTFIQEFSEFGEFSIKGKALYSRVGCYALIDIIKNAKETGATLTAIFTVQRHISSRGIRAAVNSIPKADKAIVIDYAEACSVSTENAKASNGAVIITKLDSPDNSRAFSNELVTLAENKGIKYQKYGTKSRFDADILWDFYADMPTALIGVPCKYANTSVNVVDRRDVKSVVDLISCYLKGVYNE